MSPDAPVASPDGAAPPTGRAMLERARVAVAVVFAVNGLAFASWISRLPAVRDGLGLTPAEIGLLLLCASAGSVVSLPTAGPLVQRVTAARVVVGGGVLVAAGLVAVALTEGIANDWIALALTDGHGTSDAVGALGFGAFVTP
ncbi:MAG: hypothetical protein M3P95_03825 [Actinomycetota bacterium]|nr:hypothetical protein [Actinomycetota bacterium]